MKRWILVLGVVALVAAIQVLAISTLYAHPFATSAGIAGLAARPPTTYAGPSVSPDAPLQGNIAISDTWVSPGGDTNYNGTGLVVMSSKPPLETVCNAIGIIYLGFNVEGFADGANVQLSLFGLNATTGSGNATITLYKVEDDNWPENLLGTMAPAIGDPVATATVPETPVTVTIQSITLTNYILANRTVSGGNGVASLAIKETSCVGGESTALIFQDRERSFGPGTLPEPNSGPLDVKLDSYNAVAADRKVQLEWITAGEADIVGFDVYRSVVEDRDFGKVNSALIAARGTGSSGGSYSFVDAQVDNGVTYYYRLEAISPLGEAQVLGTVQATPRRAGKTR